MLPVSAALRVPRRSTTGAVLRRREAERRHQLSVGPRTYPARAQHAVSCGSVCGSVRACVGPLGRNVDTRGGGTGCKMQRSWLVREKLRWIERVEVELGGSTAREDIGPAVQLHQYDHTV